MPLDTTSRPPVMNKRFYVLAQVILWAPAAVASPQFYTSEQYEDFIAEIHDDYHLENFSGVSSAGAVEAPYVTEGGNGFGWTLTSGSDDLWSLGDGKMSTDSPNDVFVFTFSGRQVLAFGGNFWGTDQDGVPLAGSITFSTNSGDSVVHSVTGPDGFVGIISTLPLTSISIVADAGSAHAFPTTTNVITAVPEPATVALLFGAAALGLAGWGRRKSSRVHLRTDGRARAAASVPLCGRTPSFSRIRGTDTVESAAFQPFQSIGRARPAERSDV